MSALTYGGPSLRTLHEQYAKKHMIDESAAVKTRADFVIDAPATFAGCLGRFA